MPRKSWTAVTESGTRWEYDGHVVYVTKTDGTTAARFRPINLLTVDHAAIESVDFGHVDFWQQVYDSPDLTVPEVGKAIYASNFNEYRLSTLVKEVTVHD